MLFNRGLNSFINIKERKLIDYAILNPVQKVFKRRCIEFI